jgi:hypothetical protein
MSKLPRYYGVLLLHTWFIGLALVGKDIVFRFIIKYNDFRDFDP